MKYYLVKTAHREETREIKRELVQRERIGIGWSMVDLSSGEISLKDVREKYESNLDNRAWGRKRAVIKRFLEMDKGSRVFLKIGGSIFFAEVQDERIIYEPDCAIDLKNQKEVSFEKGSDGTPLSMPARKAPSDVRHQFGQGSRGLAVKELSGVIADERLEFLWGRSNPFSDAYESNLNSMRDDMVAKIKNAIQRPSASTAMAPGGSGFERLVHEMLEAAGYEVERKATHARSPGADVDLEARRSEMFERSVTLFIQVKNYSGDDMGQGARQLRKAYEEMSDDMIGEFDEWIVITSGDVPPEVSDDALEQDPPVRFVDGDAVARWLLENAWKLSEQWRKELGLSDTPWHIPVDES